MSKSSIVKNGFTLIELIVVILIIGILASVSVPMIRGNIEQAIRTEAQIAMSAIIRAERGYYVEHGVYSDFKFPHTSGLVAIGLSTSDLNGTYFSYHCYLSGFDPDGASHYGVVSCAPRWSTAPKASEANQIQGWSMNIE